MTVSPIFPRQGILAAKMGFRNLDLAADKRIEAELQKRGFRFTFRNPKPP